MDSNFSFTLQSGASRTTPVLLGAAGRVSAPTPNKPGVVGFTSRSLTNRSHSRVNRVTPLYKEALLLQDGSEVALRPSNAFWAPLKYTSRRLEASQAFERAQGDLRVFVPSPRLSTPAYVAPRYTRTQAEFEAAMEAAGYTFVTPEIPESTAWTERAMPKARPQAAWKPTRAAALAGHGKRSQAKIGAKWDSLPGLKASARYRAVMKWWRSEGDANEDFYRAVAKLPVLDTPMKRAHSRRFARAKTLSALLSSCEVKTVLGQFKDAQAAFAADDPSFRKEGAAHSSAVMDFSFIGESFATHAAGVQREQREANRLRREWEQSEQPWETCLLGYMWKTLLDAVLPQECGEHETWFPFKDFLNLIIFLTTKEKSTRNLAWASIMETKMFLHIANKARLSLKSMYEDVFYPRSRPRPPSRRRGADSGAAPRERARNYGFDPSLEAPPPPAGEEAGPYGPFTPEAFNPLEFVERILKAPLYQRGSSFVLGLLSLGFFDIPAIAAVVSHEAVKKATSKLTGTPNEIVVLIDSVKYVVQRIGIAIAKRDPMELFELTGDEHILAMAGTYMDRLNSLSTSGDDPKVLLAEIKKFVGKNLRFTSSVVGSRIKALHERYLAVNNSLNANRDVPLGYILTGFSGAGKTHVVKQLGDVVKRNSNIPEDIDIIFYPTQNTKHQTLPEIVKIICLNDYFQIKDEAAQTSVIGTLQGIMDSAPFRFETASLAEKEVSGVAPDWLFVTTNASQYNMSCATGGANKMDRRLKVIRFSVSRRYMAENGMSESEVEEAFKRQYIPGAVNYTIGWMKNNGGSKIDFAIRDVVYETDSLPLLIKFLIQERVEQDRKCQTQPMKCGICQFTLDMNHPLVCLCDEPGDCEPVPVLKFNEPSPSQIGQKFWQQVYEQVLFRPEVTVEDIPYDDGVFTPARPAGDSTGDPNFGFEEEEEESTPHIVFTQQGAESSAMRVTDHLMDRVEDIADGAVSDAVASAINTQRKLLLAIVIPAGVFAALSLCSYLLVSYLNSSDSDGSILDPQGNFVSNATNLDKTPDLHVEEFCKEINPWMNGGQEIPTHRIHGAVSMHATLLTSRVLVFPKHISPEFSALSGLYSGSPVAMSLTVGELHKEFSVRSGQAYGYPGLDMMLLYLPDVPVPLNTVLSKLTAGGSPPKEIYFNGEKGECTHEGPGGAWLSRGPSSKGDCGLPLVDAHGFVYGIHNGRFDVVGLRSAIKLNSFNAREGLRALEAGGCVIDTHVSTFTKESTGLDLDKPGLCKNSDMYKYDFFERKLVLSGHCPIGHSLKYPKDNMDTRPSAMFSMFSDVAPAMGRPYTGKAKLIDGVWCSPDLDRARGLAMPSEYDHWLTTRAINELAERWHMPDTPIGPLDNFRAICGDVRNVAMNPKDVRKSIGDTLRSLGYTKEMIFKKLTDEGDFEIDPVLLDAMAKIEANIRGDGELEVPRTRGTIKNEALPMSKVDKAKGRLFYVCDVAENMVGRKIVLPVIAHLLKHPYTSRCTVMINATSPEWGELMKHITQFGDEVIGADQKQFDLRHWNMLTAYAQVMEKISKKIGYSDEDARAVRRVILRNGQYLVCLRGQWYFCWKGLCSGRFDTIIANSMINDMIVCMAFYEQNPELPLGSYTANVVTTNTGDDQGIGVSKPFFAKFTGQVIQSFVAKMGYTMTDSQKNPEIIHEHISEFSYLKRKFVVDEFGRVMAPLEKDSILKSMCYVTGVKPAQEAERDFSASVAALRESFFHGREYFEWLRAKLVMYFPGVEFKDYETFDAEFAFGTSESWDGRVPIKAQRDLEVFVPQETLRLESDLISHPVGAGVGTAISKSQGLFRPSPTTDTPFERRGFLDNSLANQTITSNTEPVQLNDPNVTTNDQATDHVATIGTVAHVEEELPSSVPFVRNPPESDLSFQQFCARPRLIATYSTSVAGGEVPLFSSWSNIPPVAAILQQWMLFRATPEVTITVTGSNLMIGKWRAFFLPRRRRDAYSAQPSYRTPASYSPDHFCSSSQLPHLDLDLSSTGTYSIKLPYPLQNPFMRFDDYDWTLVMREVNAPISANGNTPAELRLSVHVAYTDISCDALIPQGEAEVMGTGLVSTLAGYGAAIASVLPYAWANPAAKVLALGQRLALKYGWSRLPSEPQHPMLGRHCTNTSVMSGQPDFSYTLGADPAGMVDPSPLTIPLGVPDDTQIGHVIRKWSQVARDWPEGAGYPVDPFEPIPAFPLDLQHTPLSFVASMFTYWTGSIEMCVEIVGSPLVRQRLAVLITPAGLTPPLAYSGDGSSLVTIVEVVGTTCVDIVIPYMYPDEFQSYNTTSFPTVTWFALTESNGPSPTPVKLPVNLWMRAGTDFSLGVPSLAAASRYTMPDNPVFNLGPFDQEGFGAQAQGTFGEITEDLLVLCKRRTRLGTIFGRTATFPVKPSFKTPFPPVVVANDWTFVSWCAMAYFGERGGYSYALNGTTERLADVYVCSDLGYLSATTLTGDVGRGAQWLSDPVAEFRIPSRDPHMWRSTDGYNTFLAGSPVESVGVNTGRTGATIVMVGASDDYGLGGFLCAPIVQSVEEALNEPTFSVPALVRQSGATTTSHTTPREGSGSSDGL